MSKAKELARELHYEIDLATFCQHQSNIDKVQELIDAVLSEPEPELKGWIENLNSESTRSLVNLITGNTLTERTNGPFGCSFYINGGGKYGFIDSYDEIKQKIKEAS